MKERQYIKQVTPEQMVQYNEVAAPVEKVLEDGRKLSLALIRVQELMRQRLLGYGFSEEKATEGAAIFMEVPFKQALIIQTANDEDASHHERAAAKKLESQAREILSGVLIHMLPTETKSKPSPKERIIYQAGR